jgi:hypothetical protein
VIVTCDQSSPQQRVEGTVAADAADALDADLSRDQLSGWGDCPPANLLAQSLRHPAYFGGSRAEGRGAWVAGIAKQPRTPNG